MAAIPLRGRKDKTNERYQNKLKLNEIKQREKQRANTFTQEELNEENNDDF